MREPGDDLLEELDEIREVPKPDEEIPQEEFSDPSLDTQPELGYEIDVGLDMSTPDIMAGGGLAPSSRSGGGGARRSGYVPPNSEDYIDGSGFISIFEELAEESPFAVGVDTSDGTARVLRPDGLLYVEETESGLSFTYIGDNFADEDYPDDAKAFQGQMLDMKQSRISDRELSGDSLERINSSSHSDWEITEGEYTFVMSQDTPFSIRMAEIGGADKGISFQLDEYSEAQEFAEVFTAEAYEGGFNRDYNEL